MRSARGPLLAMGAAPMPGPGETGVLSGHMARTERELATVVRDVDVVWEVADARCPRASRNPRLARLCGERPRVLVLTHADRAEEDATRRWVAHLEREVVTVAVSLQGMPWGGRGLLEAATARALSSTRRPPGGYRAVVAGVPNSGKSTLLNHVLGERRAHVGARAGVTRGRQWFGLPGGGHLLDLPGVLAPRLGSWPASWRLWTVEALPPGAVDDEAAGAELAAWIAQRVPRSLEARFGIDETGPGPELLVGIAQARGLLGPGGAPRPAAAAQVLRSEWRQGLLGCVTLEEPPAPSQ